MMVCEYRCSFDQDFERRPHGPGPDGLRATEYHKQPSPATVKNIDVNPK
jgi:hypothetical protein